MHFRLLYFRKKEREKARESALQDLTKLGNLGALTGLEIIEQDEANDKIFRITLLFFLSINMHYNEHIN